MPVKVKKNHALVKRQMRADVARGENDAVKTLVKEAQANAPRRTGNLAASIEQYEIATPSKPRAGAKVGASYGRVVDQGSAFVAGTFFWTRALLALAAKFPDFVKGK